jgi:hypothetical protein
VDSGFWLHVPQKQFCSQVVSCLVGEGGCAKKPVSRPGLRVCVVRMGSVRKGIFPRILEYVRIQWHMVY